MLFLSKFEDHLYNIPVAAYITYELLSTVCVGAVSFIHSLRTLQAVMTWDPLRMVHSFTSFIKINGGSLTVSVISMLLFSIFYKNSSQKCYVCCKYCSIINQGWWSFGTSAKFSTNWDVGCCWQLCLLTYLLHGAESLRS